MDLGSFEQNVSRLPPLRERFCLESLNGHEDRNIVLIVIAKVEKGGRNYLRLAGIDVFSGRIVRIVDTNGLPYGLHTYDVKLAKLPEQTVIKAKFQLLPKSENVNTIRIQSQYTLLGRSNIGKLLRKYEEVFGGNFPKTFPLSFDEIFELARIFKGQQFYVMANFTGTRLSCQARAVTNSCKAQIKMGNYFVDVEDRRVHLEKKVGYFYIGWANLFVDVNKEGKVKITAFRLAGKFHSPIEWEQRLKAQKLDFWEELSMHEYDTDIEMMNNAEILGSAGSMPITELLDETDEDDFYEENEIEKFLIREEEPTLDALSEYFENVVEEYSEYNENCAEEQEMTY